MIYLNFKALVVGTLIATSAFASSVSQEDENRDEIVRAPMCAGNFDALTPNVMGRVVSFMPNLSLEKARKFVGDFNFKTFLFSVFEVGSAFASDVIREEKNQLTVPAIPMLAGGFETLTPDVMEHLMSYMFVCRLEEAPKLVTVCKFFHAYVVPKMWFSWTPKYSSVLMTSKFAQAYASRVVNLDLECTSDAKFTENFMPKFTALTTLNLSYNDVVSDGAVKCLSNLTCLDLTFNRTVTDDAVKILSKLKRLNLHDNITVTPEGYEHLPNLCVLR